MNFVQAYKWFDAKVFVPRPGLSVIRCQPKCARTLFFAYAIAIVEVEMVAASVTANILCNVVVVPPCNLLRLVRALPITFPYVTSVAVLLYVAILFGVPAGTFVARLFVPGSLAGKPVRTFSVGQKRIAGALKASCFRWRWI